MQNQNHLALLMNSQQLAEFEDSCLQGLKHKQAKKIINFLNNRLVDARLVAQQFSAQKQETPKEPAQKKPNTEATTATQQDTAPAKTEATEETQTAIPAAIEAKSNEKK